MKSSDKDCYEKIIDIDVKYTFRFMQCTGRGALTDDQTGALMVHMLSNAFYSGLFETIRHELSREDATRLGLLLIQLGTTLETIVALEDLNSGASSQALTV